MGKHDNLVFNTNANRSQLRYRIELLPHFKSAKLRRRYAQKRENGSNRKMPAATISAPQV